jgi:hypothetical protein
MALRIESILDAVARHLNGLEGVYSTVQWGGRAYKLPGAGNTRRKPRLLAFVYCTRDRAAVGVDFKLEPERAAAVVERHAWLERHNFKTLAPCGWVSAMVSSRRQVGPLCRLLSESRALYTAGGDAAVPHDRPEDRRGRRPSRAADPVAQRIDRVMKEARAGGWAPCDGFGDGRGE